MQKIAVAQMEKLIQKTTIAQMENIFIQIN